MLANSNILLSSKYSSWNRKDFGIFFTPDWVVDFMVELIPQEFLSDSGRTIYILEPACGLAQFLQKIREKYPHLNAKLLGVEINEEIFRQAISSKPQGMEIVKSDFLLFDPGYQFDLIIGNPPYGIPSLSDHYTIKVDPDTKKKYKALFSTWFGKYNVYGAFVEKSVRLLKGGGYLIFIIPATFLILDEFKKLRKFLSQNGKTRIIYMGSDIFRPFADVSTVILIFTKSAKISHKFELLEYKEGKIIPVSFNENWKGEIITFKTDFSLFLESLCRYKVGDIYEVKISPRTPEIKNSPYVVKSEMCPGDEFLPILSSKNLTCGDIKYENLSGYWIKKSDIKKLRVYFGFPHIVVGLGFRKDGKLASAIDKKCYPWMGDVYHLIRKNDLINREFNLSDEEVVEYLNSDYVKRYVKDVYREITYHLSITQIKSIPLPTKKELEQIRKNEE
jgi:adenine-specific DNA-methyltransferase